ncbi:type II toxin-antitoxin system RelE/ParE family toxin [Salmonella enterica]|uniref:type II toxin-antitoxin system RelE/ParE family toxin n=1 Tax=Hafnia paralvei TaxID=546367 RepID=UPI0012CB3597|nr:type II toxin-antitoxin system RelE/ParE family toxin [Salmonella enterica subsp. enterica serovar Infantis]EBS5182118.1 type II toxin-antitoxin system RelE/ParE family toxin [Salmonella enterica subsp. enterica serovar Chester]EGM2645704.1 type II toxin-antitoxin system RelE/ParE family toxin [Salmonella enterica]EHX1089744.1 type II toxin-antitoxin system RelE/ParE family toxin [Escherichia coli]EGM2983768.1 type II toxin-antitoxin system RelE/ParE family toxin [Salmonella enterica]
MDALSVMGIYLTPEFETERQKARISNAMLCKAAKAIFSGLPGDPLGKFTFKKRLGLPGVGARDGARSIVFFNDGDNIFFFDMYLKSGLSKKKGKELEDDEIDAYCNIAKDFISMSPATINKLLSDKELIEVNCDD